MKKLDWKRLLGFSNVDGRGRASLDAKVGTKAPPSPPPPPRA